MRELKEVFRRYRSQPIERVINLINPVLRGWVNYFAVGHSSECFSFIKDWVEKKVRRQLAHAQKRKGFGWERWSRPWLYDNGLTAPNPHWVSAVWFNRNEKGGGPHDRRN